MGLLDLLFPVSCLSCNKSGSYFCKNCVTKVQVLNRFDPLSKTYSIFSYEGIIRKGIIKIKYNFAFDIAKELADVCVQNLKLPYTIYSIPYTILVPIPLHKSRQNWRGFNQSEILGKLIAEKLNWKFEPDLLIRPVAGEHQVGLAKSERQRNMRGKFAVNEEALRVILSEHSESNGSLPTFVVFDDVATTGSTIKEAIKVIQKACPERSRRVFGLTIAR